MQHTVKDYDQIHVTLSNHLKEQETSTLNLQTMHESLKQLVEQKSNIQEELVTKLEQYEIKRQSGNDFITPTSRSREFAP
ncbi:hypothetical protein [Halalkalibacter lacteus]|uniref:hypothetical protein n=1 Tax=Halalkalibacter lacteus TaxID=3090663 RepID=UPI002FCA5813